MNFVHLQRLKVLALDVITKGHLGTCLAIRVTAYLQLVSDELYVSKAIKAAVEACDYAKLSKQKFLDPLSHSKKISKGRKGLGGNTAVQNCCIISQNSIEPQVLEKIRQGMFYRGVYSTIPLYCFFIACHFTEMSQDDIQDDEFWTSPESSKRPRIEGDNQEENLTTS